MIAKRKKRIGALGEALVLKHLKNKGFTHVRSNYLKRQGEIDVIVEYDGKIHFIEVKTVSRVNFYPNQPNIPQNVNLETLKHLPEENVSAWKMRKLAKVVHMYLGENNAHEKEWQFDVAVVYLDLANKKAYIKFIKDIPLAG